MNSNTGARSYTGTNKNTGAKRYIGANFGGKMHSPPSQKLNGGAQKLGRMQVGQCNCANDAEVGLVGDVHFTQGNSGRHGASCTDSS